MVDVETPLSSSSLLLSFTCVCVGLAEEVGESTTTTTVLWPWEFVVTIDELEVADCCAEVGVWEVAAALEVVLVVLVCCADEDVDEEVA